MYLHEHAKSVYSQYGEDGMFAKLFADIGVLHGRCAEFGAADGLHLSNTAMRWYRGTWRVQLAEADPTWWPQLEENTRDRAAAVHYGLVTPENINEIFPDEYDLFSIDVDGDDYFLWKALETEPRVVIIEINQSVPYWMSVRPAAPGGRFGASAKAMDELAAQKGYGLVGVIGCNLIFLHNDELDKITFETGDLKLFGTSWVTYLATDYAGHPRLLGAAPPWGYQEGANTEELIIEE